MKGESWYKELEEWVAKIGGVEGVAFKSSTVSHDIFLRAWIIFLVVLVFLGSKVVVGNLPIVFKYAWENQQN